MQLSPDESGACTLGDVAGTALPLAPIDSGTSPKCCFSCTSVACWLERPEGLREFRATDCSGLSTTIIRSEPGTNVIDCRFHHDLLLFSSGTVVAYSMQLGADALGSQRLRVSALVPGAKEIAPLKSPCSRWRRDVGRAAAGCSGALPRRFGGCAADFLCRGHRFFCNR